MFMMTNLDLNSRRLSLLSLTELGGGRGDEVAVQMNIIHIML